MIDHLRRFAGASAHLALRPLRRIRGFIFDDLRAVMKNFGQHDGELSTCALAFFLLISFIPASLVVISVLSYFYNPDRIAVLYFDQIKQQLPSVNIDEIIAILDRIVYKKRYLAFIWVPFLFWWGSFVFDIMERGLEKAFRIEESRKYWKAKIRHFIIILGMAFFILLLTITSNMIALVRNIEISQYILQRLNEIQYLHRLITGIERTPLIITSFTTLLLNTGLVFIIYRFIPPKKLNNSSLIKGALFASFSYEVVKSLFSYYITEINDYSSIFGSFNVIVILMIWIWYTCFLFMIGAEFAWVFYEKQQNRDLSFGE
ncbi:MAG: YihY/virulence factor BrkB family protein [Spirochaetes bacterium]|nr:YihY/virulence factor BrkB family protein [Spirochaetota bacterium]